MSEEYVPAKLRRGVAERARGCCEYCRSQARFSPMAFSVEHIHPRSKGGETVSANLALSCPGCNGHKASKTDGEDPVTGAMVPLFHPRQQSWHDHFTWNEDFTRMVGLTPTGRATVVELQLNRENLVNLREVLRDAGRHPPSELQPQGIDGISPSI